MGNFMQMVVVSVVVTGYQRVSASSCRGETCGPVRRCSLLWWLFYSKKIRPRSESWLDVIANDEKNMEELK